MYVANSFGFEKVATAKAVFLLLGSGVPLLVYFLGCTFFSNRTGLWGALICVLSFGGLILSSGVNSVVMFQCFLCTAMIVCGRMEMSPQPLVNGACTGFLCGLMALTRLEGLLMVLPFLLFVILKTGGSRQRKALNAMILVIATLLVIAPWSSRCHSILKVYKEHGLGKRIGWTPDLGAVTVTMPMHFSMGNNLLADGGFNYELVGGKIRGGAAFLDDYNTRSQMLHGYRDGAYFIRKHPALFFKDLVWKKLGRTVSGFYSGFLARNYPAGTTGLKPAYDFFIPDTRWPVNVVLLLFATGLVTSFFSKKRPLLFYLILIYYIFWTVLFAGQVSTGVLLLPLIYLFCLSGIASLAAWYPKKRLLYRMGDALLAVVLITGIIGGYIDLSQEKVLRVEGERDPVTQRMVQEKPVRISLEPAVTVPTP